MSVRTMMQLLLYEFAIRAADSMTVSSERHQSQIFAESKYHQVIMDSENSLREEENLWPFIASIIYTAAWSISFYGQLYDNHKLKSVQGFDLNYLVMNVSGYALYGTYSTLGYFYHFQGAGTVVIADLVFVYHALCMVFLETLQAIHYPKGRNRVSGYTIIICLALFSLVILETLFTVVVKVVPSSELWNPVSCLGYGKLLISFIKYTPAAYWNYKRKSTKGWSISSIIFDLIGATFSMASGGLSVENGLNITKVALAILTIVYDLIFIWQHYVLYRRPRKEEQRKLLKEETGSLKL